MVITTSQLHSAFSGFVVHLRERTRETDNEISVLENRVDFLEGVAGTPTEEGLIEHIFSSTPHPAYDNDLPNLSVLFDNLIA